MQIFNWLATNVEATAVCSQVYDWYGLKSDRHNYYDLTCPTFPNFDTDKSGSSISFIIHFLEVFFTPRACSTPQALRQLWAVNWVAPTALLFFVRPPTDCTTEVHGNASSESLKSRSSTNIRFRKRWQQPQILQFCGGQSTYKARVEAELVHAYAL